MYVTESPALIWSEELVGGNRVVPLSETPYASAKSAAGISWSSAQRASEAEGLPLPLILGSSILVALLLFSTLVCFVGSRLRLLALGEGSVIVVALRLEEGALACFLGNVACSFFQLLERSFSSIDAGVIGSWRVFEVG